MVWKLLFRDRNPVKHLVSDARSWSKPGISPRGRSRFSCLNHRFLQMFFFRGQTQKSLLRFTTLNVIIESKVTSLNLYFMSNSSFPRSSLETASTHGYPASARPCGPDWSISSTTGCDCHEFWISGFCVHKISSVVFLPDAPHLSFSFHSLKESCTNIKTYMGQKHIIERHMIRSSKCPVNSFIDIFVSKAEQRCLFQVYDAFRVPLPIFWLLL